MLVEFEHKIWGFWLKKKRGGETLLTPFWQRVDAVLEGVSVDETFV